MNGSFLRSLRLALLAILQLAVLLFPLTAANALPQVTAIAIVTQHDHAHDDETSDVQHANPNVHAADHSHDVPGTAALTAPLAGQGCKGWRRAERADAPLARLSDIDRPPRGASLA